MQHFEAKVHAEKSEPRLGCPADGLQIICVCRQMSAKALSCTGYLSSSCLSYLCRELT